MPHVRRTCAARAPHASPHASPHVPHASPHAPPHVGRTCAARGNGNGNDDASVTRTLGVDLSDLAPRGGPPLPLTLRLLRRGTFWHLYDE